MASANADQSLSPWLPRPLPVWSAPLVPIALAMTAGIVLDRFYFVPLLASFAIGFACLLAWIVFCNTSQKYLALAYLWGSVAGWGAFHHHWYRQRIDPSDISHFTDATGKPARLRGTLFSAPATTPRPPADALRYMPRREYTRFVLRVTQRQDLAALDWHQVTGLVQVGMFARAGDITVGDEIELHGRLTLPGEAMNPGEFDYAAFLRDQGITASLHVIDPQEVVLVERGWPTSLFGWLAVVRGWGQRTLTRGLSSQQTVASALLLGEGSGMTGDEWEKYQNTGVIHVLAISGQHLVVLAGFLGLLARAFGIRRRRAAIFIGLLLFMYALLTGGRPPVMRSALVIGSLCVGILIQRPIVRANTFALAWIGIALVNPTDLFSAGCQLSFLAVAVLIWAVGRWSEEPPDPLQRVIDESRPWYATVASRLLRRVIDFYAINATVWLAISPLLAGHFHLVSPIALLIGPPMVLLTSLALLTGFGFLLFAGWCAPLAWPFALATQGLLALCDLLVSFSAQLPLAFFFVSDVPVWWLWIFYVGLLIGITLPIRWQLGRWLLLGGCAWLALGILLEMLPHRPGEFRCSFVAVGHGGCTVIETPRGHVTVYDAGAKLGPEVTRRQIAPFLWSRGIRRIDELILSHADLDHYNGVHDLTERFAIGRVVYTPSFEQREVAGIQQTLAALERRAIPIQIVHAGQGWTVDGVSFEVLHPPIVGPPGKKENVRSLVLQVKFADWSMLMTGDLEEAGLTNVLALSQRRIDLLMAPHHGSDKSNVPALAAWAKPKLVVSSQAMHLNPRESVKMYDKLGIPFLGTWPHGTVTIRHDAQQAWVETYRTGLVIRPFGKQ